MITKLQAVKDLSEYDHCFISPDGVKRLGEPFGVYQVVRMKDNRSDFKGLNLGPNYKEGDETEGLDAADLAKLICEKEKVDYPFMYGRGSQLRVCCDLLIKHFS